MTFAYVVDFKMKKIFEIHKLKLKISNNRENKLI